MEGFSSEELKYTSKVLPDLIVIGADDIEKFQQLKNDPLRTKKLIGTHSEIFHCDEVLAVTMLLYTKEFSDSIIIRTRNKEVLN